MKLLTHNLLVCNSKACKGKDIPLQLKYSVITAKETEYNKDFILKLLPKLNWTLLVATAKTVICLQRSVIMILI